jgi:hypothetical protein
MKARPFHPKKNEAAQEEFKENFKDIAEARLPDEVKEKGLPIEFWFQDEARVGQQGTLSRMWAPIGSRPAMVRDNRRANAYIYGFRDPQTGRVTDGQDHAIFQVVHGAQEGRDFVPTQNAGKLF